jgi:Methyltransferase domain/Glycosyl transferase family 2
MLPFFFRQYDSIVSQYFFFDDHSKDSSLEMIRRHPNAKVEPLLRSDLDSFALSELSVSNDCWKRSRGQADWVIVIDIDEHLFHSDLPALLMRYKALGITIVPALGYQMISEDFPHADSMLCDTYTKGAPWDIYSKLALFDPSAINEIDYGVGRHQASPTGRVIAPCHDELLLLHYKFLGFERTHTRHQQLHRGLGTKDLENNWGYQYNWSEEEFRQTWDEFARNVIDVHSGSAVANYPSPRWWDSLRLPATEPPDQTPKIGPQIEQDAKHGECFAGGNTIISNGIPAISPVSFWIPDYICPSAWTEHAPFAFWICEALRPRCFVELGTHFGYSYFAFCQAIERLGLGTAAYAVDNWEGDEHAGLYDESVFQSVVTRNNDKYAAFSSLVRSTFQDALRYFTDGSIDLLHIDGRHFYDDVKENFNQWRVKLTENAVVLLHDTNVREHEFGVWKFFEKVAARYPSFQFFHGYGLGVLIPGHRVPSPLVPLLGAPPQTAHQIRTAYATLGGSLKARAALEDRKYDIKGQNNDYAQSLREAENLKA